MEIEKISNDNFTLQKEGSEYILYMGSITQKTPRPFTIKISGVEDSSKVVIEPKCGCTSSEKTIIDKHTLTVKIAYNDCNITFTKTVSINNNGKNTNLKIKGACQHT